MPILSEEENNWGSFSWRAVEVAISVFAVFFFSMEGIDIRQKYGSIAMIDWRVVCFQGRGHYGYVFSKVSLCKYVGPFIIPILFPQGIRLVLFCSQSRQQHDRKTLTRAIELLNSAPYVHGPALTSRPVFGQRLSLANSNIRPTEQKFPPLLFFPGQLWKLSEGASQFSVSVYIMAFPCASWHPLTVFSLSLPFLYRSNSLSWGENFVRVILTCQK